MITKFNEFNLIKESPDQLFLRYKNGNYKYTHVKNLPSKFNLIVPS